jgi:hypothetical protein
VEGWLAAAIVAVGETKSVLASLLNHQCPMERLQATPLAQAIIDAMGAMESISRYPDLTRLGISEGAVVDAGPTMFFHLKWLEMVGRGRRRGIQEC